MSPLPPLSWLIDRNLNYGREHVRSFLSAIPGEPNMAILDLGAGRGEDLAAAREAHPEALLYAVEVFPPYRESLNKLGCTVHSLNLETDSLPLTSESVDVVMANQVLEHIKEIFWVFHEVTRVLKVGGSFVIGVPNLASLHNRLLLAGGRQPSCLQNHSAHVRGYTRNDLVAFVETCFPGGYREEEFRGANFYPFPPLLARPLARAFPGCAWGIFLRFRKLMPYDDQFLRHPIEQALESNFKVSS